MIATEKNESKTPDQLPPNLELNVRQVKTHLKERSLVAEESIRRAIVLHGIEQVLIWVDEAVDKLGREKRLDGRNRTLGGVFFHLVRENTKRSDRSKLVLPWGWCPAVSQTWDRVSLLDLKTPSSEGTEMSHGWGRVYVNGVITSVRPSNDGLTHILVIKHDVQDSIPSPLPSLERTGEIVAMCDAEINQQSLSCMKDVNTIDELLGKAVCIAGHPLVLSLSGKKRLGIYCHFIAETNPINHPLTLTYTGKIRKWDRGFYRDNTILSIYATCEMRKPTKKETPMKIYVNDFHWERIDLVARSAGHISLAGYPVVTNGGLALLVSHASIPTKKQTNNEA